MASADKLLNKGPLQARAIFEVIGRPKEHVEKTVKAYIENLKTDEEIKITSEEYEPAEEVEDDMYGAIAEIELTLENIEKLTWLCMNFSPASIEVIEPSSLMLEDKDITHWLNDLLSKLHEIGVAQKAVNGQNEGLIRNFNAMTRNAIILSLQEPRSMESISKKIGLTDEFTEKFLDALLKEGKIKKEKSKYKLI